MYIFIQSAATKRFRTDQFRLSIKNGIIFVLKSKDIFDNLAFEDCLYKSPNRYTSSHVPDYLLWVNEPCVVIGAFQNPWVEFQMKMARENNIKFARRYSGGGTVFHDKGNLNISYFQANKAFSRTMCMQSIADGISSKLNKLKIEVGKRYDLWAIKDNQKPLKISGGASRLSSTSCYHHCTLLCNANLNLLQNLLKPTLEKNIESKGSKSVPSDIINLNISTEEAKEALIEKFSYDLRKNYATEAKVIQVDLDRDLDVFMSRDWFKEQVETLKSFNHKFGRTPPFQVQLSDGQLVTFDKGQIKSVTGDNVSKVEDSLLVGVQLNQEGYGKILAMKDSLVKRELLQLFSKALGRM